MPEVVMVVNKIVVSIPLLSCSSVQCYFSRSTEWKTLSHAQEWKLNRFFSSDRYHIYIYAIPSGFSFVISKFSNLS